LRIDPTTEPWTDRGARLRVRVFGAMQLVAIWGVALAWVAATW